MRHVNLELGKEYTKIKYPAGELQVRLPDETGAMLANAEQVSVLARINSSEQIIELCLLIDAIRNLTPAKIKLVLPYLPYARADRRFVPGDCFGLAVFASLLLTLEAQIVTLDAHSSRASELLPGLEDISALPLIGRAIELFARRQASETVTVLFPDEGARKRYQLPQHLDKLSVQVLHCSKKRDAKTGKFTGFSVPAAADFGKRDNGQYNPVIIVDDICDGGGTFNGIADNLKDYNLTLGLYVTHGIFSKGLDQLAGRFNVIYTTDSFKEWSDEERLQIIPAIPLLAAIAEPVAIP